MTEEVQLHETSTSLVQSAPDELNANGDMLVQVRVACASPCNLQGNLIKITDQDTAVVKEIELTAFDETANETKEFLVKAPINPGKYTWKAVFPAQEKEGVLHQESSASFSFLVRPHSTSMTVWDIPSPIALGTKFKVKLGVICTAGCKLTGKRIEIYDHKENQAATGKLSDQSWSAAGALYWTEVELKAPDTVGVHDWSVKFPKPDHEFAHEQSTCLFSFATASPPDYIVTVQVMDEDSKTPLESAIVTLYQSGGFPYRTRTDADGVAKLSVPKGKHELYVAKLDYKDLTTTAEIDVNVTIQTKLKFSPDLGA